LFSLLKIRITCDDAYCISVAEDGSIVIWRITDAEGRTAKAEKEFAYATEVLITKYVGVARLGYLRDLSEHVTLFLNVNFAFLGLIWMSVTLPCGN